MVPAATPDKASFADVVSFRMSLAKRVCGMLMLGTTLVLIGTPATAEESPKPARDSAWQLYDRGFARLADDQPELARKLLADLVQRFPDHPAAAEAGRRLAEIDAYLASRAKPVEPPNDPHAEPPNQLARGELALTMTTHGVLLGLDAYEMLDCDSARCTVSALMLGGGLGLGASLYFSRHGITPGHTQLLSSAITWGGWNGLFINDGFPATPGEAGVQFASQLVGLAGGLGLWRVWRPTSGEVAMVNTAGFWTAILTVLGHGMVGKFGDIEFRTIAVAADLGLFVGGLLTTRLPGISRGRTLLIDTGGVLGFLAGGLIVVTTDPDSEEVGLTTLFVGTAAGLGLGALATRRWDVPKPPGNARLTISPMGRRGWGASVMFDL